MEQQYGIAITNKYDLFIGVDNDQDPFDIMTAGNKPATKSKDKKSDGKSNVKKNTKQETSKSTNVLQEKPSNTKFNKRDGRLISGFSRMLDVKIDKVPSRTTVSRMAIELNVISDLKVAEYIVKTPGLTLGMDATTQEGIHINVINVHKGDDMFTLDVAELADNKPPRRRQDNSNDGGQRGGFREGGFRDRQMDRNYQSDTREGQNNEERRGGPPRGRGRGGRGGFGGDRFGRQKFDRHSGSDRTGVKAVEKRGGGGAHNWGTEQDEVAALNETNTSEDNVDPADTSADNTENTDPNVPETEVEIAPAKEPEPLELTLAEYKQMQAGKKLGQKTFNIRKAGEGCDDSQWKDMEVYRRDSDIENDDEDEEEEEHERIVRKERPAKYKPVDIQIRFREQPRRGGRGRGSGGRGGFGDRDIREPREYNNAPRDEGARDTDEKPQGGGGFGENRGGGGGGFGENRGGGGGGFGENRGSGGGGFGENRGSGGGGGGFGENRGFGGGRNNDRSPRGRGGFNRGRGSRGGSRGAPKVEPPKMDSQADFPSL